VKRGDIVGVVLVIVFLAIVLVASLVGPDIRRKVNFGFGPEWDCFYPGKGDPICVKNPAKAD
jgi:hypothetical protein